MGRSTAQKRAQRYDVEVPLVGQLEKLRCELDHIRPMVVIAIAVVHQDDTPVADNNLVDDLLQLRQLAPGIP